jgi:ADP-heptose:LPS heptosyltransferase
LLWIALAPGALWPSKQWPAERFAAVGRQLLRQTHHALLLVGGERERAISAAIAALLPERSASLTGELDILQTAAILQQCRLTITNDSGLLHVAEAVGCPVVALFGPTTPRFGYAPHLPASHLLRQPPPCSPCSKNGSRPCHRPTHECMLAITTQEVVEAVTLSLAKPLSNT